MLLTVDQTAERLNMSATKVRRLCAAGTLTAEWNKDSKRRYYKIDDRSVTEYKKSLKPRTPTSYAVNGSYVNVNTASKLLNLKSDSTIYAWAKAGKLRILKIDGRNQIPLSDIQALTGGPVETTAPTTFPLFARLTALEQEVASLKALLNQVIQGLGGL